MGAADRDGHRRAHNSAIGCNFGASAAKERVAQTGAYTTLHATATAVTPARVCEGTVPFSRPRQETDWANRPVCRFAERLAGRRSAVKSALMDHSTLAGVGNIYADETLFLAGVAPNRPAAELDEKELRTLHRATRRVLQTAIRNRADGARLPRTYLLRQRGQDGPCPKCGHKSEDDPHWRTPHVFLSAMQAVARPSQPPRLPPEGISASGSLLGDRLSNRHDIVSQR